MSWLLLILKSAIKAVLILGVMSVWALLALGMWVLTDNDTNPTPTEDLS